MPQSLIPIFFLFVLLSCSKSQKENQPEDCIDKNSWLTQKKAEYSSCVCLTGIYQGVYQGEKVFIVKGMDPLCDGIDIAHRSDGTPIIHSGQQDYQSFLSSVQNLQLVWSCTKSN